MKNMSQISYIILVLASALSIACEQANNKNMPTRGTGQLISLDFADTNYIDVPLYAKDTVTLDGWAIKYLVKDDSSKYNDIYIQWTKGDRSGLYHGPDILLMRRYFIPELEGENNSHIFLTHGCATSCAALLVLSKDSVPKAQDFSSVFDYNIKDGQLVYIPERSYSLDTLEVSVVDLNRKEENTVIFKNICNLSPEEGCIDSVHFDKNYVRLFATLIDKNDKDKIKPIKENQTVKFDK